MGFWEEMSKPAVYFHYDDGEDSQETKRLRAENERLKKMLLLDAAKENEKLRAEIAYLKEKQLEDKRCKLIR